MMKCLLAASVVLMMCLCLSGSAQSKKVFDVETLHAMKRVGEHTTCTTVGGQSFVAWTERSWVPGQAGTPGPVSHVLKYSNVSTNPGLGKVYTVVGTDSANPTFSADCSVIYYLQNGEILSIALSGGSPASTLSLPVPVEAIRSFSYKGHNDMMLMVVSLYPTDNLSAKEAIEQTAAADAVVEARGANTWFEFDDLFIRHWGSFVTPGKYSHILVSSINNRQIDIKDIIDIMKDLAVDSPVPPFGGLEQIDVAPDGTAIAYTGALVNHESAWNTAWQVFEFSFMTNKTTNLFLSEARNLNPRYSPDGKWIAFLAMNIPGRESDKLHINRYNRKSGTTVTITNNVDISFADLVWTANSQSVLADAEHFGFHTLFTVDMHVSEVNYQEPVSPDEPEIALPIKGASSNFQRLGNQEIYIFEHNSMSAPSDLHILQFIPSGTARLQLTHANAAILESVEMPTPQRFHFSGWNNDTVYGWIIPPINFDNGNTYPVVELIHGGPEGTWNDDWSYRWNPMLWANHGYGVIMIDFHGSVGYGQEFQDAILGHWGDRPYEDIITGTEFALKQYPWMDSQHVGACGASYGGYMINWLQGHTKMFSSLVTHDGIFSTVDGFYATDELWFPEAEFQGLPYKVPENYEKFSPNNFVESFSTPHLVIHGNHDYRIPLSQGLGVFTALQRQGIPSKFLYFTQENHWVLEDENGIKWYGAVLSWLDAYLKQ